MNRCVMEDTKVQNRYPNTDCNRWNESIPYVIQLKNRNIKTLLKTK